MQYQINQKIINIEIVSISDYRIKNSAYLIKPKNLLRLIQSDSFTQILFTNTLPDIFLTLQQNQTLTDTYFMSYRAFLSFVTNLTVIPIKNNVSWLKCGF